MSATYAWADHRIFAAAAPDGRALLFGTSEASLFALDDATQNVVSRWRSRKAIALRDAPRADRGILKALRDARVLVPSRERHRASPPIDPATFPLATLVLDVAQSCNLRCSYCYAGGGSYGGAPRLMQPALARRAARFLIEHSGGREQVTLVLFGGEPLLNLAAVEAAVTEAETAAEAAGKKLVVSLTTNGTRFTPRALDFLRDHRVGITVSIDGPPDVHDANRRYARRRGGGTYADVVAGLERLRAHGGRPPAARVTLTPEQWARVPEVFTHVLALGCLEVGIAPASPVNASLLPTPEQDEALFAGFARLADRFERDATQGRVLPFSNLLDLLARLHLGRVQRTPCGAGLGYLAVDAAGRFFLCHRFAGEDGYVVGDLESGVDYARIRARLPPPAAMRSADCRTCWARSLCAGGCYHENHLREVRLGLPAHGSCAFIRRWLELGIRVYAKLCHDRDHAVMALLGRRAAA